MNRLIPVVLPMLVVGNAVVQVGTRGYSAEKPKMREERLQGGIDVEIGPAVVVALAKIGEKRWGFHQFPALARLPGGRIALSYSHNTDAVHTYGTACPTFVSDDEGKSWKRMKKPGSKPHPSVCAVAPGEFLRVPPARPFNLKAAKLAMPEAFASTQQGNRQINLYEFAKCPRAVQSYMANIAAWRWTPQTKRWRPEKIKYDTRDMLIWKWATGPEAHLVPRTWFEHPPVKLGDELIYADYRTKYAASGDKLAALWSSTCMASRDAGRTWERRGTISVGTAKSPRDEPVVSPTADGRLACAIRTSPGPLVITYSSDRGRTWSAVKPLHKFGVFPDLLLLENKVLVVSFGRPGVHLKFSADGTGRKWTEPVSLIPAKGSWNELSCGYTSLLAVGYDGFLIAYSDFKHRDEKDRTRKAILVRKVRVTLQERTKPR